jgi:hypothetical protein
MNVSANQTLIRRILYANAIFSGVSGILFVLASNPIAKFIGLDASLPILIIGIGLIGYAALIYSNVSRREISPSFVLIAVIGDTSWVLLSILLLTTGWVSFSMEGKWLVGSIAMIVDIFATLQFLEWRKM